ncbi:diguanylate cyclase [Microvirga antarctica]|uniref:diguanylate cyclase n=1 Tax=Microvirga antarctica TaxID=2819233 RepID=UPI001B30D62C|nr:diguanylate cyclase [Microvirga antarctica]
MGSLRRRILPRSARLPAIVLGIILVTLGATIVGFTFSTETQRALSAIRAQNRDVRVLQLALLDLETGARGFVLSSRMDYLQPYNDGLKTLDGAKATLATLDRFVASSPGAVPGTRTFSALVAHLRAEIATMVAGAQRGGAEVTGPRVGLDSTKVTMDVLREYIVDFLTIGTDSANAAEEDLAGMQKLLLLLQIVSGGTILAALVFAFRGTARESRARAVAVTQAVGSREQVEHLFAMTDMLQSATGYDDANAVLRATVRRLLPNFGGALYIFNNSGDRLDLSTAWGPGEADPAAPKVITPSQCWALKRGKPHLNLGHEGALRCGHALGDQSALEIPMLARGEVYGLLQIFSPNLTGTDLDAIRPLAIAIADSMSLALSSIALRERLRNQALRDPLTGLYNRRFMEEVLESFAVQAERRQSPLSAIMIDLDHFKKLNDTHGHAAGDTVLRDVAGVIMASLRKSDIACRYGGEELIILLPDSDLETALAKAETVRIRIAELSPSEGVAVSASLGVASIPETSSTTEELTAMADEALYKAKQRGRNNVVSALRKGAIGRFVELQ